jgi:Flp pilus assembly protein TadB
MGRLGPSRILPEGIPGPGAAVKGRPSSGDTFSRLYFYVIPWTVPVVVALLTWLFRGVGRSWIWVPLLLIYGGTIWMWVLHRSGRLVPQCFYHGCANFLSVFPMISITVLHLSF